MCIRDRATAKKVKGAKSYEFQYSAKKNFSSKTKVTSKKNTVKLTGKKIKSKKKIYVRTRVKTSAGSVSYTHLLEWYSS